MKILLIHNFYRIRGGEDEHVDQLSALLSKRGNEVVSFFKTSQTIDQSSLKNVVRVAVQPFYSRSVEEELEQLIRAQKPDIAHVHNIFPLIGTSAYRVLRRERVPIVQSIHNYRLMCLNGLFMLENGEVCERCKYGNFAQGVVKRCYQKSFIKSAWMAGWLGHLRRNQSLWYAVDRFVSPSSFVALKLEDIGCPKEKISIVPYFSNEDSGCLLDCDHCNEYVLYVGRLSKEKGLNTLIQTAKMLPNINFKIVGQGPLKDDLMKEISSSALTNVDLLGFVDDASKKSLITRASCLVFPSECYETLGLTILEAFKYGIPVIASALGGRESLVQDGVEGKVFLPGNPSDLARAILDFMKQKKRWPEMKRNARKKFLDQFTEEKAYENLFCVYQAACVTDNLA